MNKSFGSVGKGFGSENVPDLCAPSFTTTRRGTFSANTSVNQRLGGGPVGGLGLSSGGVAVPAVRSGGFLAGGSWSLAACQGVTGVWLLLEELGVSLAACQGGTGVWLLLEELGVRTTLVSGEKGRLRLYLSS